MPERPDRFGEIHHAPGRVKQAKHLRHQATASEQRLWKELRRFDAHIRRQAPMGRYVVDFVCHAAKLVIELDGGWHLEPERQLRDIERDAWLDSQGYRVLRFDKERVFSDLNGLIAIIHAVLAERTLPPRWGKGRVGGAGMSSAEMSPEAGPPRERSRSRTARTPSQLSPIEGEGS